MGQGLPRIRQPDSAASTLFQDRLGQDPVCSWVVVRSENLDVIAEKNVFCFLLILLELETVDSIEIWFWQSSYVIYVCLCLYLYVILLNSELLSKQLYRADLSDLVLKYSFEN